MSTLLSSKPDLEPHFKALGFDSLVAYKLWCYRNNLSTSLDKTPAQLQKETDLFQNQTPAPDTNQHHDPRLAQHIVRIFNGECQNDTLTVIPTRIRTMYNSLQDNPEAQKALCRLILHVEKYADLLRPTLAKKGYGQDITNTHLGGLAQLARHHKDWIRPVEDWRPTKYKARLQFHALARYLLAKIPRAILFQQRIFSGQYP